MLTTGIELEELADNLRLKRMLLRELTSNVQDRLGNIKALRKKLEKELGTAVKTVRKE
ncbi:hypothetical protein [Fannyhessea vaginae]|uniref:hypothetical protein n=1 Tax=Fannyhessea vaginae TaxID=82135 RepID=UPI00206165EA|nr:hypothetical protein [Fannyhessea vaginae]DAK30259.1 MAG TPA: hypothetical protein [Caudoviricetes sp.]